MASPALVAVLFLGKVNVDLDPLLLELLLLELLLLELEVGVVTTEELLFDPLGT